MEDKIKNIRLPILYSEGRQLQLAKDGYMVHSYDPVYNLELDGDTLKITGRYGYYIYTHNLSEFDDIVVEEFKLDDQGDRIYEEPYLKYKKIEESMLSDKGEGK